jgi:type III restriction enzyme
VVRLCDDSCLVIETKGLEDPDVPHKDARARRWARDASALAGRDWAYEKVPQKTFDAFTGSTVEALRRFIAAQGGTQEKLA